MSAINVNSITGRTGSHGPVLTGITTATNGLHVTSGDVGIGVDTPTHKLHIVGTGNVQTKTSNGSAAIIHGINSDNEGIINLETPNDLTLHTNNTERLRITSGGDIGIGTDNPGSLLTLDHATNPAIQLRDSGTKVASINAEGTQTNIASFEGKDLVFAASNSSAFTERVRITGIGGSVGIGTESPTTLLEVGNQTTTTAAALTISRGESYSGGTGPIINLKHGPVDGTQRTHQIYSYSGNLRIVADSNHNLELWSAGAERFKINSNGDIATGSDASLSRLLMLTMCYARLVSHSGCNSAGPSGTFTEFDNSEASFTTVQGTVTAATSGYTFVGNNDGKALAFFVGCGDNPVFGWQDSSTNAPSYWSWVLVDSQFVAAVYGLPTNTTRTSLP